MNPIATQYMRVASDVIKKLSRLFLAYQIYNIKIAFSSIKLRLIFRIKDCTTSALRSIVVYRYSCSADPINFYIGKSWRQLYMWLIKNRQRTSQPSAINNHLSLCESCCNGWLRDKFEIVHRASNKYQLEILQVLLLSSIFLINHCLMCVFFCVCVHCVHFQQTINFFAYIAT